MSRLAKEMKYWPEMHKISQFRKYEVINMKTYKCRNKNNLSPIVNQEFDPNKIMKDQNKLYEPRVNAYKAIKMHLDNVEMASTTWLHNRSVNAMENLSGIGEENEQQSEHDVITALKKQNLNQVSSRNLKTNMSKLNSGLSKLKQTSDGISE